MALLRCCCDIAATDPFRPYYDLNWSDNQLFIYPSRRTIVLLRLTEVQDSTDSSRSYLSSAGLEAGFFARFIRTTADSSQILWFLVPELKSATTLDRNLKSFIMRV